MERGRGGQALGLLAGMVLVLGLYLEGVVRTVAGAPVFWPAAGAADGSGGPPEPVGGTPAAAPAATGAGQPGPGQPPRPTGKARPLTQGTTLDGFPDWSPDGRQIAFMREGRIWLLPAGGGEPRPIPGAGQGWDVAPVWSPDGRRIAVVRLDPEGSGPSRLVLIQPDTGAEEELLTVPDPVGYVAWAPDGSALAYTAGDRLEVLTLQGRSVRTLVRVGPEEDLLAGGLAWSPDGRWLLYAAGPKQPSVLRYRLYRVRAAGGTPEALGREGGVMPAFSPDGRHLAYRRLEPPGGIAVMNLETGASALWIRDSGGVRYFHPRWSPDGRRLALSRLEFRAQGGNLHLSSHVVVFQ